MKWSEFVSQVNAEIAKSDTPDPEIEYIDISQFWDAELKIYIIDEELSVTD